MRRSHRPQTLWLPSPTLLGRTDRSATRLDSMGPSGPDARAPGPRAPGPRAAVLALSVLALAAGCGGAPAPSPGEPAAALEPEPESPVFLWLEDIEGDEALDWVRAQNERSLAVLEGHPLFAPIETESLEILNSPDRIPYPNLRGGLAYNFWRDATHERGLWRVTTPEDYRNPEPAWETVLDVDALAAEEDENWVWSGASCRYPVFDRCIISLSIGGADATVRREFDLTSRTFIEDGFTLPESKSRLSWRDRDTVFLGPALDDDVTTSGYPRRVLIWTRGTPWEEAVEIYAGEREDVSVWSARTWDGETGYDIVGRSMTFFTREYHLWKDDALHRIEVPDDARLVGIVDSQIVFSLRTAWEQGGDTFASGALIGAPVEGIWSGGLVFSEIFTPGPRQSINQIARTANAIVLSVLDNVSGRLLRLHREADRWVLTPLRTPELGSISVASSEQGSDRFYYTHASFLTPPTLHEAEVFGEASLPVRTSPAWFDATGMAVSQHEVASADGTMIPYFLVTPAGFEPNGTTPTLLGAYGGFEISRTPFYSGVMGRAWLERGGAYVLANIRGGGEFGPGWHQAALREHRQRSFDDLIAVAEDLIAREITSPAHLGIQGGSNGGLLVGAVMVQRPELFNAVISAVPLLDMLRYHLLLAGASWMAEYGNPDDPDDRAFLEAYSPLQNLRADVEYPVPFFWTSTRDDRVHPGHARRMVARMLELGHDVFYYENIEGGHGGAANQRQRAHISGLTYAYLWLRLGHATHDAASARADGAESAP